VLDFALGYLPSVHDTQRIELLEDSYIVLLREGHPFVQRQLNLPVATIRFAG